MTQKRFWKKHKAGLEKNELLKGRITFEIFIH